VEENYVSCYVLQEVRVMAKRKKKDGVVRKLTKTGKYTYYVTIPREYIESLDWRKKQKVVVRLSGKKIIIEDWKK
jgi:hypothetical protein